MGLQHVTLRVFEAERKDHNERYCSWSQRSTNKLNFSGGHWDMSCEQHAQGH